MRMFPRETSCWAVLDPWLNVHADPVTDTAYRSGGTEPPTGSATSVAQTWMDDVPASGVSPPVCRSTAVVLAPPRSSATLHALVLPSHRVDSAVGVAPRATSAYAREPLPRSAVTR